MARPLRIERPGGRYHVTSRGNQQKAIYRDDRDRAHFLELLADLPQRFGVRIHAYILMDNHFHLLLETPEANLSRAMQWLSVSYSVWFNRRHERSGHLFQGRFKAVLVEDDAAWQEVARYVHLNPVRVTALGLNKRQRAGGRLGAGEAPSPQMVAARLKQLRQWRWSSYRAYANYTLAPAWLTRQPLDRLCGGRTGQERLAAIRQYTEEAVRQGVLERPWDRLVAGMVLGSEAFARRLLSGLKGNAREQKELKQLTPRPTWKQIVRALEKERKERWQDFVSRYGDWGRDAALWLGRRAGRLKLSELAELAGGIDYAAAGTAVSRFARRLAREPALKRMLTRIENRLLND
jgi:REP element-mobilizing transposase RayT